MRIGLVSDTHVPAQLAALPKALLDALRGVDAILHAGDLVSLDVIDQLAEIAPTTAVAGNMDPPVVASQLTGREIIEAAGRTIGLQHGHQRAALQNRYIGLAYDAAEFEYFYQAMTSQLPEAEIIVFGHFHVPLITKWRDRLFINPGAVTPSHGRSTFAFLTLGSEPADVRVETVEL